MNDWEFKANDTFPGYGYIEPIADADCELMPEWLGNIIVSEVNQLRARVAELESALSDLVDLAEYWIGRGREQEMSEERYRLWLTLGHRSMAMIAARTALEGRDDE